MSLMKVFYGWAKLGKVRKREAISIIYENEVGVAGHHRMGKSLKTYQETVYERYQTDEEAKDSKFSNRIFTEFSIFLDDPKINGSLTRALYFNSMADKNNVSERVRKEIADKLKIWFLAHHPNYKEPTRELELNFMDETN